LVTEPARDDGGANRLQVRHDGVPVALDALRQILEVLQLREAAQLLVDVAGDGVHGVEAPGGDGVPAGLHARLGAGARLEDELLENLAVVQLRLEQHLRHEVVQHARVGGGGLAAEHQVRGDVIRAPDARGERRERETAGARADGLVELHEVALGRAHALHGAAPQRHQRHQLHGDRVQVLSVSGLRVRTVSGNRRVESVSRGDMPRASVANRTKKRTGCDVAAKRARSETLRAPHYSGVYVSSRTD
jgi:hypothetical protein